MIKKITTLLFTAAFCIISYESMTNANGPGASYSNAPKEANCTSCHSGSLQTSGSDWNNIALTTNFTGGGYIPDSTYTINLNFKKSGISKFGFQITFLDASDKKVGTISSSSSRVKIFSSSSLGRDYAGHTSAGTSSTGTNSTDWDITWKAPSTNVGAIKAYVTINAANGNNNTSGDVIYAKEFTINPSSLLPVAKASSNDTLACSRTDVQLMGSSTNNATSWSWNLPRATPSSSSSQNPVIQYNSVGTFWAILTTKNAKGSSNVDSLKIVVRPIPGLNISGPSDIALCKGDSVRLIATINPNYAYTWTPGGSVNGEIWAKDTGHYFVSVKDQNNCTNTAGPVIITHNPSHTVSITRAVNNDTVCFERDVEITAKGSTDFDTLIYYNQSGVYQRTADNPSILNMSTSNDIFVRGLDSNGCLSSKSNQFNFIVKNELSAPVANCSNKSTGGFEIEWSAVTGAIGYEVSLDSGKTWETPSSGTNGLKHVVFGFPSNTDVLILLKALDVFPCFQSPITKIVCGSIPCSPLVYNLVWDKDACKGSEIKFRIKDLNSNSYSFSVDNGKPFKDTLFTITADFTRTYKFELTDSVNLSCPTIKRDAAVTVWQIPSQQMKSNSAQDIFCEGDQALFNAVAPGMEEYDFYLNNVSQQKGKSDKWTLTKPKNLDSVWVKIKNGACNATSDKIILGVKTLPTAKFSHTLNWKVASFTADEPGNAQFIWDFGDGTTDSSTKNPIHDFGPSGKTSSWVRLTVIDEFGCVSVDSVELSIPLSLQKISKDLGVKVFPQPALNQLNIELPEELFGSQLILKDATGRVLIQTVSKQKLTIMDTYNLGNGIYFLNISKGERNLNTRIIIAK